MSILNVYCTVHVMFSILDTFFNVVFFPDTYYIYCAVNVYIYTYSIWLCILCTTCMICIVRCICVYVVFPRAPAKGSS